MRIVLFIYISYALDIKRFQIKEPLMEYLQVDLPLKYKQHQTTEQLIPALNK